MIEKDNKDIILKGDLIRYPGHVAIVYSEQRPVCSNSKDTSTCTYDIIHAYGYDTYTKTDPKTKKSKPEFSRKVIVTGNDITATPTGFGRIKLWD